MAKKKHTASSQRWLDEHFEDEYVKKAKKLGLRSRAVFKIEEINNKDKLIKQGMKVVDLGAAPGGWSEYAVKAVGDHGQVVACDILPMDAIVGVDFLEGDFREEEVLNALLTRINGTHTSRKIDVVMSDMAANMTGNESADSARSMYLVELALDMCNQVLKPNGAFVVKVFQGAGFEEFMKELRQVFKTVKTRKPESSRARSREVYLVATGFKG